MNIHEQAKKVANSPDYEIRVPFRPDYLYEASRKLALLERSI